MVGCFPYWPAAGVEDTIKRATWIVGKCTALAGVQAWPAFFVCSHSRQGA